MTDIKYPGVLYKDLNKEQKGIVNTYNEKIRSGEYKIKSVICICGHKDNTKILDMDRYGFWHPVVMCEQCGLLYANPRPVDEVMLNFYSSGNYGKIYRLNDYSDKYFENQVAASQRIISEVAELTYVRNIKSIFEFGCGAGWNLIKYKEFDIKVSGCDLDLNMIEAGKKRGLDLKVGSFELLQDKKYDFIILNHVVEHFNNFWKDISKIWNALSSKGILYIAVPNSMFFAYGVFQNSHNYYFNRSQLNVFMSMAGFKKINSGYMYNLQDFFGTYERADDILNINSLTIQKESFKSFLKGIGVIK